MGEEGREPLSKALGYIPTLPKGILATLFFGPQSDTSVTFVPCCITAYYLISRFVFRLFPDIELENTNPETLRFHTYMHSIDPAFHTRPTTITGEQCPRTKSIIRDATNETQSTIHHIQELQTSAPDPETQVTYRHQVEQANDPNPKNEGIRVKTIQCPKFTA